MTQYLDIQERQAREAEQARLARLRTRLTGLEREQSGIIAEIGRRKAEADLKTRPVDVDSLARRLDRVESEISLVREEIAR